MTDPLDELPPRVAEHLLPWRTGATWDNGWGVPNPEIAIVERQARLNCRRTPAEHIQDVASMVHCPHPAVVARRLNAAGIPFVLIGAHALAVHTKQPRATLDVDVVVSDVTGAVAALRTIRRGCRVRSLGEHIGMRIENAEGVELIDVLHPHGGLRGELLSDPDLLVDVVLRGEPLRIPNTQTMLALKWLAMFSPSRILAKRSIDKGDFLQIFDAHANLDVRPAARLVAKASATLAAKLLFDMEEYRATGKLKLYDE